MEAFNYSGFHVKPRTKRICQYSGSLVGRDLKAFAQMSLFPLQPYLTIREMAMWTTLINVRLFNDELKLNTFSAFKGV